MKKLYFKHLLTLDDMEHVKDNEIDYHSFTRKC